LCWDRSLVHGVFHSHWFHSLECICHVAPNFSILVEQIEGFNQLTSVVNVLALKENCSLKLLVLRGLIIVTVDLQKVVLSLNPCHNLFHVLEHVVSVETVITTARWASRWNLKLLEDDLGVIDTLLLPTRKSWKNRNKLNASRSSGWRSK